MKKCILSRATAFLLSIAVLIGFAGCGSSTEIHCAACGTENDNAAKFCAECGAALSAYTVCRSCGWENNAESKFCSSCGNALSSQSDQGAQGNGTSGDQPTVDNGTAEGDPTDKADPAENVWLLVKETNNHGIEICYSYDSTGNLTEEVHAARSSGATERCHIINTLDERNRLIKREWGDYVEEYTYDDNGALSERILYYDHSDLGMIIHEYDIYEEGVLKRRYSSEFRSDLCDSQGRATQESLYYFVTDHVYDDGRLSSTLIYRDTVQYRSGISAQDLKNTRLSDETILFEEYTYYSNGYLRSRVAVEIYYHFQSGIPGTVLCDTVASSGTPCRIHGDADCSTRGGIHYSMDGTGVIGTKSLSGADEEYTTDRHGNVVQIINGTFKRTFEYMTLAEYRKQGLPESGASTGGNGNVSGGSGNDIGVACQHCQNGWIDCNACDGTGKVFDKYDINGNEVMKICSYRSTYSYCTGGKIRCYFCGGDGIFGN